MIFKDWSGGDPEVIVTGSVSWLGSVAVWAGSGKFLCDLSPKLVIRG